MIRWEMRPPSCVRQADAVMQSPMKTCADTHHKMCSLGKYFNSAILFHLLASRLLTLSTRFDELSMRTFLNAETNFVYCLTEGCQSGQIHDTGVEGPIFRCAACGYRMCTAHDPVIPFHENEACTQYNERVELERVEREARDERVRVRREQDEASAAEAGRSSVECPGCGVQIQKIDGCDHMTCKLNCARPTLTDQ